MARRKIKRKLFARHKKWKLALKITLGCFLFSVAFFSFLFLYFAKDLPRPEVFTEKPFVLPTKIYDRTGEVLLYQIFDEEKRTVVGLDRVSDNLKHAIIAAEDANFYRHFGLDFGGIFRSIIKNIQIGEPIYGGSTLSQQLIRSSFLTPDKTIKRKVKEVILTLELERRYSKDKILEFYLNQVPFGSNAYGVEAAAQTYFNKSAAEVSLEEAALLASLIQAPSYLSPYGSHQSELLARKNYILNRMAELEYVSRQEADEAKSKKINFAKVRHPIKAPHFVLYIKEYLENNYSDYFLKTQGLKVYTTLDWELQEWAETVVKGGVERNKNFNAYNAGLVSINPQNGEVLAMVGSADWFAASSYPENCVSPNCQFDPKVNVTVYGGGRQPGSAFKPFAYAQAFKKGFTTETILWDVKTEFTPNCTSTATEEKGEFDTDCYHPKNYDEKFRGPVTMREALAQSINVPSVKTLWLAGLNDTIGLAKKMGIATLGQPPSWYGLSLVLGGGEVKLLDMVSAYGVFATEGYSVSPVFIRKIEDAEGSVIEENKKTPKRVLEVEVARQINNVLSDNEARAPLFGRYSPLYFPNYEVAAKTGTTQEYKDAWTIGYTPRVVAGVWAGNNNGTLPDKKPGLVLAAPIWHKFMEKAIELYPAGGFNKPAPIKTDKPTLNGEVDWQDPHSILHYINKDDPQGEKPEDPARASQYTNWEEAIQNWLKSP